MADMGRAGGVMAGVMGVGQGVALDSLKHHSCLPSPTLVGPVVRGWATPEMALRPFQGLPAPRAGHLRLSSTPPGPPLPHTYGVKAKGWL
jgi:hypothetical protein